MRAQPKVWFMDEAEPKVHYFPNGDVIIECEIVAPKSSEGRNIDIHVTAEVIPGLLKELRSAAINLRNKPMESG